MRYILPLLMLSLLSTGAYCQKITISGSVTDESGEALPGVSVLGITDGNPSGVYQTDAYGRFSILLKKAGNTALKLAVPGCTKTVPLGLVTQDTFIRQAMDCSATLQEIDIVDNPTANDNPNGIYRLTKENIQQTPTLGGEPDVMKTLALLPGITNGIEGSSGLYIRGGSPDQNLILLDDAPVYNTSHLFGFLSIFNTDIIKEVTLYKGNSPARFGGRISSVLDIHTVEGNQQKIKGNIGIGLFDAKASLNGPLLHNRLRFSCSARSSYLDLFTYGWKKRFESGNRDSYTNMNFYDINGKINFDINKSNQFFISVYTGHDQYDFWDQNYPITQNRQKMYWGNTTVTARLHSVIKSKFYLKNTFVHSGFKSGFGQTEQHAVFDESGNTHINGMTAIQSQSLKSELTFVPLEQHVLRAGLEANYRIFTPRQFQFFAVPAPGDTTNIHFFDRDTTFDMAVWIEDEFSISNKLSFNAGGRFTCFSQLSGKVYFAADPRLMVRYKWNKQLNFRADYGIYHQNINLLSNNSIGLPLDIWTPSDKNGPVQRAWQTSAGVEFSPNPVFSLTNDCYFRKMHHLTDLRTGANLLLTPENWEQLIEKNGTGTAWGDEIAIRFKNKRWRADLAYTWSKNTRSFQQIDNGASFFGKFDQRNRITAQLGWKISPKWYFSADWIYNSGIAVTLPIVAFEGAPGATNNVLVFPKRNNTRFPAYHRGDLSFSRTVVTKNGHEKRLSFGVYNFYNRRNVYYLEFKNTYTVKNGVVTDRKLEVVERNLFPIIPSVTYNVSW